MIIKRGRSHKVRVEEYESNDFWAAVEIDTTDEEHKNMSLEEILDKADEVLEDALVPEAQRTAAVMPSDAQSHIFEYYKID